MPERELLLCRTARTMLLSLVLEWTGLGLDRHTIYAPLVLLLLFHLY